jgi:hypothetical protein
MATPMMMVMMVETVQGAVGPVTVVLLLIQ